MAENIDIIHEVLYENEMILVTKFQTYHKIQIFRQATTVLFVLDKIFTI